MYYYGRDRARGAHLLGFKEGITFIDDQTHVFSDVIDEIIFDYEYTNRVTNVEWKLIELYDKDDQWAQYTAKMDLFINIEKTITDLIDKAASRDRRTIMIALNPNNRLSCTQEENVVRDIYAYYNKFKRIFEGNYIIYILYILDDKYRPTGDDRVFYIDENTQMKTMGGFLEEDENTVFIHPGFNSIIPRDKDLRRFTDHLIAESFYQIQNQFIDPIYIVELRSWTLYIRKNIANHMEYVIRKVIESKKPMSHISFCFIIDSAQMNDNEIEYESTLSTNELINARKEMIDSIRDLLGRCAKRYSFYVVFIGDDFIHDLIYKDHNIITCDNDDNTFEVYYLPTGTYNVEW